jgi:hypothetical protein
MVFYALIDSAKKKGNKKEGHFVTLAVFSIECFSWLQFSCCGRADSV